MSTIDDLKSYLEISIPLVKDNVEIVTPADLFGDKHLYHISFDNNIKTFTPIIGRRQLHMEDRTTPRICTAPTLIGCMKAHMSVEHTVEGTAYPNEGEYKGGFVIYGLPFEFALKVGKKLVNDADITGECWLVTFDKDTISYKPDVIGKGFYRTITVTAKNASKDNYRDGEMYFEVIEDGLQFNNKVRLDKGYWKVEGPISTEPRTTLDDPHSLFTYTKISESEYLSVKGSVASMLSFEETKKPHYSEW